ncbi:MAG: hypothetical protein IJM76_06020 [Lachnospiraceae bacterium]|nr:hypothetical protein [Lachnospiraceae bacterium]
MDINTRSVVTLGGDITLLPVKRTGTPVGGNIKVSGIKVGGNVQVAGGGGGPAIPDYEGEYTVTPKMVEQVLETADKRMLDDVTVRAIPYYEVGNDQGGTTVYIAMEG